MDSWTPTAAQCEQYDRDGYLIIRGLVPAETAFEMRGVIKNVILSPEADESANLDPMDPMGDSPTARAARFRKLANFCVKSPLIWHHFHAGPQALAVARHFLGDDIVLKFNSCFLKPARTGSATPWHQDNGLWRDGDTSAANAWMALDPATRENGCLQFIPGSHRTEIVEHVLYEDSIHGELPRERVTEMIASHGLHHVELAPGDAVFWHSSLWHYSPPNTSARGRIAIAGVWTTPALAASHPWYWQTPKWCLRGGEVVESYPPEEFPVERAAKGPGPYRQAEAAA